MDDIECLEWLEEVGLPQYQETFLVNFSKGGYVTLSCAFSTSRRKIKIFLITGTLYHEPDLR